MCIRDRIYWGDGPERVESGTLWLKKPRKMRWEYLSLIHISARMAQHAGEFDTARMLWFTTYQSTKDARIRQNAVEHLLALQVDEDITRLEQVIQKYRAQTGHLPSSFGDIERAGFIRGTPADPKGHAYRLMPCLLYTSWQRHSKASRSVRKPIPRNR